MKKVLVFAGIFAIAAAVQAATLSWAAYGALNDGSADEDWFSGGQAYLVMVTDTANFDVSSGASGLEITGGQVVDSGNIVDGAVTHYIDKADVTSMTLTDGSAYTFAILFTSDGVSGTTLPTTGMWGLNDNEGAFYTGTWNDNTGMTLQFNENTYAEVNNPVAVPEPTSVALLALGLAALGLKRKVA